MEIMFDISEDELPIFLAEVDEHLQVLDEVLIQLEQSNGDPELLQQLFRAAHTLKGMSGMINHRRMTELTHAMETAFDGLRKNTIQISTPLVNLCLDTVDGLRLLREEVVTGQVCDLNTDALIEDFQIYISDPGAAAPKTAAPAEKPVEAAPAASTASGSAAAGKRKVNFYAKVDDHSVASAARAFQIMMALQGLGEITNMVPTMEQIETASPVHEFSAELITDQSKEAIIKSVDTISEIGSVRVSDENGQITPAAAPAPVQPVAAQTPKEEKAPAPAPTPETPVAANDLKKNTSRRAEMTVRTSVERLDNLMNLVGELITDRNHLYQIRSRLELETRGNTNTDQLSETVSHLGRITDQLQEEVMHIRMLPISNVFSKFPRMVRDIAQKTGKKINLTIQGEDTELDRSMIEEINDPLIHLLRNAVDHGIETPDQRVAAGKSETGNILLAARYEQGRIVLTIQDDGHGIDTNKVRRSAVQKGLISEEEAAAMTKEQAIDLIFMPGLSTAQKVTDVSGRGVGMDIVHTNIQRVNGTIQVESVFGQGTTFQIVLPLTLAIVPTLLVRVHTTVYAIPLVMVTETLRLTKKDIRTIRGKPTTLLRGNVLSLLDLSETFGHVKTGTTNEYLYAVVVNLGKQHVGLIVEALTGEEEVVVKSLGSLVGEVPGISSAAILGDGTVALIIDVPGLFRMAGIH